MTKEQAIEVLNTYYRGEDNDDREFCDAIEMAIKVLEQQPSDDCVSRADLLKIYENRFIELQKAHQTDKQLGVNWCINTLNDLPPVTPTHCIAEVRFSKDDLREICNERIESTHGTCKDCKHYYMDEDGHGYHCEKFDYTRFPVYADFYCKDFEKRGDENEAD
jgi:hypothetical protein